uniref:Uncharacterized protein n=1 Tax=Anguilla anguilla TaxID=7936 RepID=A0A0E9S307_ANGAN
MKFFNSTVYSFSKIKSTPSLMLSCSGKKKKGHYHCALL